MEPSFTPDGLIYTMRYRLHVVDRGQTRPQPLSGISMCYRIFHEWMGHVCVNEPCSCERIIDHTWKRPTGVTGTSLSTVNGYTLCERDLHMWMERDIYMYVWTGYAHATGSFTCDLGEHFQFCMYDRDLKRTLNVNISAYMFSLHHTCMT